MEPRPSERGNLTALVDPEKQEGLQWSHVLPNVETARIPSLVNAQFTGDVASAS
jgi:hypothetical protein